MIHWTDIISDDELVAMHEELPLKKMEVKLGVSASTIKLRLISLGVTRFRGGINLRQKGDERGTVPWVELTPAVK